MEGIWRQVLGEERKEIKQLLRYVEKNIEYRIMTLGMLLAENRDLNVTRKKAIFDEGTDEVVKDILLTANVINNMLVDCVDKSDRGYRYIVDDFLPMVGEIEMVPKDLLVRYIKQIKITSSAGKKDNWRPQKSITCIKNKLKQLKENIDKWKKTINDKVYQISIEIAKEFADRFKKKTFNEGYLSYQDILFYTRNLLRDNFEVRQHFQNKFDAILIDEFQIQIPCRPR